MKTVLITGSSGLVGSAAVDFFYKKKFRIFALDNDFRGKIFGKNHSTNIIKKYQQKNYSNIIFLNQDIAKIKEMKKIFQYAKFNLIIHAAGQPSHDWSAKDPLLDFNVNAVGTLNLLELTRKNSPKATFIFTSTNKVYGDLPNYLKGLKELPTRYEVYQNKKLFSISENFSIDNSKHSPFGVSKTSADLMVQEYGRYFNLKTGVFRCGCITGPNHQGAELHGFLSYLVKCIVTNKNYTIHGYKGKQVRDNIHSEDLVNMFWHFYHQPGYGEIYNAGGGRENSISILETINLVNKISKKNWNNFKIKKKNRSGDHIWYVTNFNKFKKKFPNWKIKYSNEDIIEQIIWANTNKKFIK
jgi:CDP-paratose 2-epimerase